MIYLIDAAQELGLDAILSQVAENKNVHGVMIDVNPMWAWEYKLFLQQRERTPLHLINEGLVFPSVVPFDIYWRGDQNNRYGQALIVKVLLRPGSPKLEIRSEKLTVVQEHRAVPVFQSANPCRPLEGGLSLGHGPLGKGTLGGILKDTRGNFYGMTCGHVIQSTGLMCDQPAQADAGRANTIGKSVYHKGPVNPTTSLCTPFDAISQFNRLDIALIEIDPQVAANLSIRHTGLLSGVCPPNQMHRNLMVEFTGAVSNHRTLILGGIGVTNKIKYPNGDEYCFEHLIEIKDPSVANLGLKRPSHPGDSGAWITTQGASGTEWCGMLVAGDQQTGYFILADYILAELSNVGYHDVNCY